MMHEEQIDLLQRVDAAKQAGLLSPPHARYHKQHNFNLWILNWLDQRNPTTIRFTGLATILCIGCIGYTTGPFLSSSLLYLIPLLIITHSAGFKAGAACSLLAAALWFATDLYSLSGIAHPVTPYWNVVMRLGTFLLAVSLVAAMRTLNTHLEERVQERTAALEVQIAETRELEKTILEISDRERAAVGQDLHDGLCQQLVSAAFTVNLLRERLTNQPNFSSQDADHIADMIDDSITQARNLARGLYPVRLETEGLEMAIRELASSLCQRFKIQCEVECPIPLPKCPESIAIHLYRIAQEAVTNAAKHANAQIITIRLTADLNCLLMSIEDDGIGIKNTPANPVGMGLSIMEYRARIIDATFLIESPSQGGTRIICKWNLAHENN